MPIFWAIARENVVEVWVVEWIAWENFGCSKSNVVDSNFKLVSLGCVSIMLPCSKFAVRFQ
jgi:hypothetical protein